MIELDGATLRISASYGLKVPGAQPYSSEDAHYSFSIEQPLDDGLTLDQVIEQASDLASALETGVKLQGFSALSVAFEEVDGTLRPVFETANIPTAAPKAAGRPASGNRAPQQRTAPTSDRATVTVDFGLGVNEYLDNRPLKAGGEFKAGAADFRSAEKIRDGGYHSVWLAQKGGGANQEVVAALAAAGIN
jgi:hypothetical protein